MEFTMDAETQAILLKSNLRKFALKNVLEEEFVITGATTSLTTSASCTANHLERQRTKTMPAERNLADLINIIITTTNGIDLT